ncbi:DNA-3-methyladenine glycosylase [Paenibacillus silviterrae]|uniref:DNA-3-methyladenine glycosylase n=1 Tax=Paenibacillus silviterrae TaxID=3242194 RepID=UPI0025428A1B|nr:DNA-3-methyladenine glycosylase [Paenibacillus chinjuensis]
MDPRLLEQDTVEVARQLIGCHLVRRTPQGNIRVKLTETEAYRGSDDPASHAYRGRTPRNHLMFGEAGRLYVYFIYGMHHCMNIVAHRSGEVGAVLLRGGWPIEGIELLRENRPGVPDRQLVNGPGKLAKAMGIGMEWNGYDLLQQPVGELFLEWHTSSEPIRSTPRIGISKGKELLWRFVNEDGPEAGHPKRS